MHKSIVKPRTRMLQRFALAIGLCLAGAGTWAATLLEAEDLYRHGEYREAIRAYKELSGPEAVAGVVGASRVHALMGDFDEAENVCRDGLDKHNGAPEIATQLAEVLFETGRSDEALTVLEAVVNRADVPLRALVKYGEFLDYRGRFEDARVYFAAATTSYASRVNVDSEITALAARAHWLSGNYQEANRLFREAVRQDRYNMEAHVWWGDLFAEKFNSVEARQSYQQVLDFNPTYPPALIGLAKETGNKKLLERALFANPKSGPVFTAYAELSLKHNKFDEAKSYLDAALPHNPESLEVITPLAGIAILREDEDTYEQYRQRAESLRPGGGEFYTKIADYFSNDYRFKEAVQYARRAIEVQADYWPAYTVLGMNLIRLGEEAEGRERLEFAYTKDPYNLWTSNILKLFDTLEDYVTFSSPHFTVRMSEKDGRVLWPYLEPLLEDSWNTLEEKYGFTPEGPVLVEVFEKQEDFAVRSAGLPDIGPLVGICFGKVITLISPDTLTANWQEIVWHEFAHVITLQMTENRIPRWLSEGISVWEEHQARPEWGQHQDLDIQRALDNGRLFPIERIDDAFFQAQSNEDLGFAYLQSYLVVEYIADTHGFDSLKQLIEAYGGHGTTEDNIEVVFDQSVKAFNQDFSRWVEQRMEEIDVHVADEDNPDEGAGHGHGVRSNPSAVLAELYSNDSVKQHMLQRIRENRRDFQAYLQLGIVLFKEKEYDEAEKYLKQAKEILPRYTAYPSPPLVLAQIYEARGEREKQLQELEFLVKYHQHNIEGNLTLARAALDSNDLEKAEYHLQRAVAVDPYRLDVHALYASLADKRKNYAASVREYGIIAQLDRTDPVESYTNLAQAYLRNGDAQAAKRNSLVALEVAPTYEPAQRILLESLGE